MKESKACLIFVLAIFFTTSQINLFGQGSSAGPFLLAPETEAKSKRLTLVRPMVFVTAEKEGHTNHDPAWSAKIEKHISDRATSVLSGKYDVTDLKTLPYDTTLRPEIKEMLRQLDTKAKNAPDIVIPDFFQKQLAASQDRLCLLILLNSSYNAYFQPEENTLQSLQNNRIYINRKLFASDMRLVIFDKEKNTVVYYDKDISKMDARVNDFVQKATGDILKPVYYKLGKLLQQN